MEPVRSEAGQGQRAQARKGSRGKRRVLSRSPCSALAGQVVPPDDESFACPANRAVVSYSFWQREMGGRELAPDSKIFANDQPYEVIGVTPPNFTGIAVGETFDIVVPFCQPNKEPRRDVFAYSVIGRLRPGWTLESEAARLEALSAAVMEAAQTRGYG